MRRLEREPVDDMKSLLIITLLISFAGCASIPMSSTARNAESELASLRKQLEDVYGNRDVAAFGALHTDSVVYEWRGRPASMAGRAGLENTQREIWATRRELRRSLAVGELRIHSDRAYEFGSYEETWIDPQGSRVTEFGRYVMSYVREFDGTWRVARTFGFAELMAKKAE